MLALQQVDAPTRGGASSLDLSGGEWWGNAFQSGFNDPWTSVGHNLQRRAMKNIYGFGQDQVSPEEANRRFGIDDERYPLKFDQPVSEVEASMEYEFRRSQIKRMALMDAASHNALSLKGMGTLTATFAAAVAHPIDIAAAFFPWVGSEKVSSAIAKAGGSAFRVRAARGFALSEERIAAVTRLYPKITSSIIDATISEAVLQIPQVFWAAKESGIYKALEDYNSNLIMAGLTGGAFRTAMEGLAKGLGLGASTYNKVTGRDKLAMDAKAQNDALFGTMIKPDEVAALTDEVVLEQARFRMDEAQAEAELDATGASQDINAAAKARLKREGTLGRVNQADLLEIASTIIQRHAGNANPPDHIAVLRALFRDAQVTGKLADGMADGGQPRAYYMKAMANILGMTYNNAEFTKPSHYRLGEAEVFDPNPGQRSNPDEVAAAMFQAEQAQAKVDELTAKLNQAQEAAQGGKADEAGRRLRGELKQAQIALDAAMTRADNHGFKTPGGYPVGKAREVAAKFFERENRERLRKAVEQERNDRMQAFIERKKAEAIDSGRAAARAKALKALQEDGRILSPELAARHSSGEKLTQSDLTLIETDVVTMTEKTGIGDAEVKAALEGKADPKAEAVSNAKRKEAGLPEIDYAALRASAEAFAGDSMADEIAAAATCMASKIVE